MSQKLLTVVLVIVAISMGALTYSLVVARNGVSDNTASIHTACVQVQKLETVIRAVLVQDLKTFGLKGTAGFDYYRLHPAELAAGRFSLEQEIAEFSTRAC